MPVVVDFDFGSTPVTRSGYRERTHPKILYAPPEVIMYYMRNLDDYGTIPQPNVGDVYDWWSLGMTLFDWWTGNFLSWNLVAKNMVAFSPKDYWMRFNDNQRTVLIALVKMTIVHYMLHNSFPDADFNIPVGALNLLKIAEFAKAQHVRLSKVPPNIVGLLKAMLSWSHERSYRCFKGKAGSLLTIFFEPVKDNVFYPETAGYNEGNLVYDYCTESQKKVISKRSLIYEEHLKKKI